jgi:hypothetical protein
MENFYVKKSRIEEKITKRTRLMEFKTRELIMQVESLEKFYYELGLDSENIKTIFALTLAYLRGKVDKLVVRSFFDVLMSQSRLNNEKEINLLNCFDELIESYSKEQDSKNERDEDPSKLPQRRIA